MNDSQLYALQQVAHAQTALIQQLEAKQEAAELMLKALIASHPDLEALRQNWHQQCAHHPALAATLKTVDPNSSQRRALFLRAVDYWNESIQSKFL